MGPVEERKRAGVAGRGEGFGRVICQGQNKRGEAAVTGRFILDVI